MSDKSYIFCVLLLSVVFVVSSATIVARTPVVHDVFPHSVVPAGTSVAYTRGHIPWSNPAGISADTTMVLQVGYENRYFSSELSDEYISFLAPTRYFNVSASFNFFGFSIYHEMMANVGFARKFGICAVGIEALFFAYYDAELAKYNYAFAAQTGVQVGITKSITLSGRIFNPTFSQIKTDGVARHLPVLFDLGCNYRFANHLDLLFQVGYAMWSGVNWGIGAEYEAMNFLAVKVGARGSDYIVPMLGAGIRFEHIRFDVAFEADFRVGMSVMSNLQYRF